MTNPPPSGRGTGRLASLNNTLLRAGTGWSCDEKACSVGVFLTHLVGVRVPPTDGCLYGHIENNHHPSFISKKVPLLASWVTLGRQIDMKLTSSRTKLLTIEQRMADFL